MDPDVCLQLFQSYSEKYGTRYTESLGGGDSTVHRLLVEVKVYSDLLYLIYRYI